MGSGLSGAHVSCRTSPDPRQTSKALLFPCNADIYSPPYMKMFILRFHLFPSPRVYVHEHISHLDTSRMLLFTWTREDGVMSVLNLPSSE